MKRRRAGSALLEVLAATTIFTIGGVASVSLMAQVANTVAIAQERDAEIADASSVLDRISLYTVDQLHTARGESRRGNFMVSIQQISPALFRIQVLNRSSRAVLLETVQYRREHESNAS